MSAEFAQQEMQNMLPVPLSVEEADTALKSYLQKNSPFHSYPDNDTLFPYYSLNSHLGDPRFNLLRVDQLSIAENIDVSSIWKKTKLSKRKNLEAVTGWYVNRSYTLQGKQFDNESFVILQAIFNSARAGNNPYYRGVIEKIFFHNAEKLQMLKEFYGACGEREENVIAKAIYEQVPIPIDSNIFSSTLFAFAGQRLIHDALGNGISIQPFKHKKFGPDILSTEIPNTIMPTIPGQNGKRYSPEVFTIGEPVVQGFVRQEESPVPSYGFLIDTELKNRGRSIADMQKEFTMGIVPTEDNNSDEYQLVYHFGLINEPQLKTTLRDFLVAGTISAIAKHRKAMLNPFEGGLPGLGKQS